jgi:hypothetical protein
LKSEAEYKAEVDMTVAEIVGEDAKDFGRSEVAGFTRMVITVIAAISCTPIGSKSQKRVNAKRFRIADYLVYDDDVLFPSASALEFDARIQAACPRSSLGCCCLCQLPSSS